MTRKRFIKLVMSKGYGRNYAAGLAEIFVSWAPLFRIIDGNSYEDLWRFFTATYYSGSDAWRELLNHITDALGLTVSTLAYGFNAYIQAIKFAVDTAVEALRNLRRENIEGLLADYPEDGREDVRAAFIKELALKGADEEDEVE